MSMLGLSLWFLSTVANEARSSRHTPFDRPLYTHPDPATAEQLHEVVRLAKLHGENSYFAFKAAVHGAG